ncbi:CZB domain-containing protein [Celeribacter sp.]|uniref:CZB domain-containing protein n=1 Tax=Celeribacter sp. TaxID=1890673 RepID=UPI003A950A71
MDRQTLDRQISEAIGAHAMWRTTLNDAAQTGILPKSAEKIGCDDDCPFGKWLHSLAHETSVSGSAEYKRVVDKHARFHKYAGEVAMHVERGDKRAASDELASQYLVGRSYALLDAMLTWQTTV